MWNNTNPAELFSGTTWELITAGKYIQSGSTALSTGGSNSVSIAKANLPAVKVQLESFSVTTQPHIHKTIDKDYGWIEYLTGSGKGAGWLTTKNSPQIFTAQGGGANTGTASPYTQNLGSGTTLSIQPSYITLKFWKRLS